MSTHKKDGYVSFSPRVKKRILARDGNVCKYPACTESIKLDVHHIDGDKKNHSESNLITLCHSHHSSIERTGEDIKLADYFRNLIANKPKNKGGNPAWVKGMHSPNPLGRPPEGESWAGVIKWAGNITCKDAIQYFPEMKDRLEKFGEMTLKQATSMRAFSILIFDPTAGLLNAVMERAEGKLAIPTHELTGDEWRDWLKANYGYTDSDIDSLVNEFAASIRPRRIDARSDSSIEDEQLDT